MGTDLFAIDVQRGRDHGVAPYYKYYLSCKGVTVNDWRDLRHDFSGEHLDMLKLIYESVFDMDLVTGVMMEKKVNRIMGAVGRCIMVDQLYRLKYADRFFYKFSNTPKPYSKGN